MEVTICMQGKILTTINPIQYSNLAKGLNYLKNPNAQGGTLLIEIPADIGKAYNGYKRGGIIEAAEKLRKEGISALIWMFGIPIFNKLGNSIFEKVFKLPMNIDYSDEVIKNSVQYLANPKQIDNLDVSELAKYGEKFVKKINELGIDKSVKRIKGAKKAITLASWALNCFLMGVALPKINQKITEKKLKEKNFINEDTTNRLSFEEFQKQTKKTNQDVSFTGLSSLNGINGAIEAFAYGINTNNTVRLVSTDVPMIIGRCATARNKYEALEIGLMDSAAIFFYNFCLGLVEKNLGKKFGIPQVNAKVAELITTKEGMADLADYIAHKDKKVITQNAINESLLKEIRIAATNGRYGKINRFVDEKELNSIDKSIIDLFEHLSKIPNIIKDGKIDEDALKNAIKKVNMKNLGFYGAGIVASFMGLGWLVPKVAYFITEKVSGKSGFVGINGNDKKCK